jgi:hypothetical protein
LIGVLVTAGLAWNLTARAAYETAEYKVIQSDGKIEIREYPDLMLASTDSQLDSQGRDGSFMRLFRYISGANEPEKKIEMTTPVFMESQGDAARVSMGFVMPKEVAAEGVPAPTASGVKIRKRKGGRFAVIRFAGRMDSQAAKEHEAKLREWMKEKGLEGEPTAEAAGYDPPFTPAPLRRNEILIRLRSVEESGISTEASTAN